MAKVNFDQPVNMICPKCGSGNYVYRLDGDQTIFKAKCINCNYYLKADDMPALTACSLAEDAAEERGVKMDAIEYLKKARRMCQAHREQRCKLCPFHVRGKCLGLPGDMSEEEMVETVLNWKPGKRGDMIRAMNDRQLAQFIRDLLADDREENLRSWGSDDWLGWLQG